MDRMRSIRGMQGLVDADRRSSGSERRGKLCVSDAASSSLQSPAYTILCEKQILGRHGEYAAELSLED